MRFNTRFRVRLKVALVVALLTALTTLSVSGCFLSKEVRADRQAGFPMTIKDGAGREVKLQKRPQRMVSMAPSNTEILFALGLGDKVVGVTTFDNYPPEATKKEKVGDSFNPNYEKIVGLKPDLVLAVGTAQSEIVKKLDGLKVPTFVLQASNLSAVYDEIALIGKVTGTAAKAQEVVAGMQAKEKAVLSKVAAVPADKRPKVFWMIDDQLWTVGPGSFINDILVKLGAQNVAAKTGQAYSQFNMESLLKEDPGVIIAGADIPGLLDKVKKLNGWSKLSAVKNNKVYTVNPDLVSRPGPRIIDGLEAAAKVLYPDLFK